MRKIDGSQIKDHSIKDSLVAPNAQIQVSKIAGLDLQLEAVKLLNEFETTVVAYREFTYTAGKLSIIDVWDGPAKNTLLFVKSFGYSSDLLTSISLTRLSDGLTVETEFQYDLNNVLISKNVTLA
jgi:hypothetical protein